MKIIKITEKQDKLLKEMEVVQYQDNDMNQKQFYSELHGRGIDWESKNSKLKDADLADQSVLKIEWSCTFAFKESGFSFKPVIDRVYGELIYTSYDWDTAKTNVIGKLIVDTKNGWKVELPSYGLEADSNQLVFPKETGSVEMLIDSKTIRFFN